jgi:naphthoate synthase
MPTDELADVLYEVDDRVAWITINRPERFNSTRNRTIDELIACFLRAWDEPGVGVVVLTAVGDRSFNPGHDQKEGETDPYLRETHHLQQIIRDIPKPVIASVNGVAVGGGHVLHTLCDLTIAADTARFGQVGPKVGSFDASAGPLLARIIGEKRAREMWMLNEPIDAQTALQWGLVNRVVPPGELHSETRKMAENLLAKSPTALRVLKHSFNANSNSALGYVGWDALAMYRETSEATEGERAYQEKRPTNFEPYRRLVR